MIESINMWKRSNDNLWSICIVVIYETKIEVDMKTFSSFTNSTAKRINFSDTFENVQRFRDDMIKTFGVK